ncbi:MAG TPA: hypothetical protein VF627_10105 [Abditibacterium sp.]
MPVTVNFDEKARPKTKGGKAEAQGFDAYALPADRKNGLIALAVWLGILLILCLPWWFSEATQPFAIGMPLWCLAAALGVMFIAPAVIAGRLKKSGKGAVISSQNQAPIKSLLTKASKIYGIREPDGFIETPAPPPVPKPKARKPPKIEDFEEVNPKSLKGLIGNAKQAFAREEKPEKPIQNLGAPSVRVQPNAVLVHKDALTSLDNSEISALVVQSLVHLRQGHARRLFLLDFIDTAQPKALLYLAWPVLIYGKLLRAMWLPHARQNADRLALFLVKNPNLMLAGILKDYAACDANMQALNVSAQDVTNWINQAGHIGMAGEEISTQYKLGRAIHEDPPLELRLQNLQNWAKSEEFSSGLEKLKASR